MQFLFISNIQFENTFYNYGPKSLKKLNVAFFAKQANFLEMHLTWSKAFQKVILSFLDIFFGKHFYYLDFAKKKKSNLHIFAADS